jgi:DNA-directed RNA polymerase specialized sigma24 family protein
MINKLGLKYYQTRSEKVYNELYKTLKIHFGMYHYKITKTLDKDDMFQITMLRIYRFIDNYDSKYAFSTWVNSIYKNVCYSVYKKEKQKLGRRTYKHIKTEGKVYDNDIDVMYELLNQYEHPKSTLLYYLLQGYKNNDIMKILEITRNAYAVLKNETLKDLQDKIKKSEIDLSIISL